MTTADRVEDGNKASQSSKKNSILYGVDDVPAPHLCFLFAIQQATTVLSGMIAIPFIISNLLCADANVTAELLSITSFMCGLATVLQTTFGVRLGIVQGASIVFISPIVAMMSIDKWKCQASESDPSSGGEQWKVRMREIQGSLILASLTQLLIGCTGVMGFLMKFIGPLTIAPTISLIGLSLTGVAITFCKVHWGIAALSLCLMILSSLYLGGIKMPFPAYSTVKGCHLLRFPVFQLFPVLISICVTWLFSYILTVTDVLPTNSTYISYAARTDAKLHVLQNAPLFYWPYPFKFGVPTVSVAGYVGFLAATLASIIESIGDYYACARISGAPPPPTHAVNRGIVIEGFCSIISGLVGAGHGTTSYSENIGAIGITKVASRRVFLIVGIFMIVCGVIGKIGAVLTIIPQPVVGGTLIVMFGMIVSVGISTLKFIDLNSLRNLTILGVSLILGLIIPQFVNDPNNSGVIDTGNAELDQVLKVMLGTAVFVGGTVGFILDNTVSGTQEERGLLSWRQNLVSEASTTADSHMYELPYITNFIRKVKCCYFVPISPTFNKSITCPCCNKGDNDSRHVDVHAETYAYDNAVHEEDGYSTNKRLDIDQTRM